MKFFSFLIGGIVNDDAVRLKTYCDLVVGRYLSLSVSDLHAAIGRDFPGERSYCDQKTTSFAFADLKHFRFSIDHWDQDNRPKTLSVVGHGQYAGYMLQGFDGGTSWASLVSDGIAYRATGGAKKLARVMEKKFSVRDNSKYAL